MGFDLSLGELTHSPSQVVLFTGRVEIHVLSRHSEAASVSHQVVRCAWLLLSIVMRKRPSVLPAGKVCCLFFQIDACLTLPQPAATVFLVK